MKDLEKKNSELEERHSTLQNENQMLRQVPLSSPNCSSSFGWFSFVHKLFNASCLSESPVDLDHSSEGLIALLYKSS